MDLNKLKEPFPRELISWRVGAMNKEKTKAIPLAYIDARDVMQRLDEVCGVGGWQALYPHANGKTSCKIGIKIGDEWVWKENGAGDSDIEATKGAFSDAFKRAAVLWGVGRYLYDVPNIWVEIDNLKRIKTPNDPRFAKALEAAEKGIRLASEEEPQIQTFSGEEFTDLQKEIKASTVKTIDEIKQKARAAWPRMNDAQQKTITKLIKDTEQKVDDIPTTFDKSSVKPEDYLTA